MAAQRLNPRYGLSITALLGVLAVGCSSDPTGTASRSDVCSGDNCGGGAEVETDAGVDLSPFDIPQDDAASDVDDVDVVDDAVDDGFTDAGDDAFGPDCPSASRNECGGCDPLENEPGEPCGECEDGSWVCDGYEAVECLGAALSFQSWWPDIDNDDYGDDESESIYACTPPSSRYASDNTDCDDGNSAVNPGAAEVCDGLDNDCNDEIDEAPEGHPECIDACCDAGLVCEEGECLIPCDTIRCGELLDSCCPAGDVCYADTCSTPGGGCEFTEECALDEICEPTLGICLPRAVVPACEYVPDVGDFSPSLGCRWTTDELADYPNRDDVVATPIVINLTDDNDDGVTDRHDIPDVAFLTYDYEGDGCCNELATLRIVSGRCDATGDAEPPFPMVTLASISSPHMTNDTGLAAGDLDNDGVPEIVAVGYWGRDGDDRPQGTIAFERLSDDGASWGELWRNEDYPIWDVHTRGGATISLADLNHDGNSEVIIGNVAINGQTGELLWDGLEAAEAGEDLGIGNNAFLGPASTVADVDLDGNLEVIAGNTLYSWDGDVIATFDYATLPTPVSNCGGNLPCDGMNAVGNFDDDNEAEIVIIRQGQLIILEHDMQTLLWFLELPHDNCHIDREPAGQPDNEAGPPTVADFDGDSFPEIGTAGADYYIVADMECDSGDGDPPEHCHSRGIRWAVENDDCTSRVTASSVFDFEGDGAAEVVYADETSFRIFDGRDGTILYSDDTHGSHTRIEMPVIVDVDNDGNAEVVIPENGYNSGLAGLDIWDDVSDNWVRTRRIWNQHGYHVTNVDEDGRIPQFQEPNWLNERLNNFRQNVQPDGLFDAPDLLVSALEVTTAACAYEVEVTVENEGALSVPDGALVRVELVDEDGDVVEAQEAATTVRLFPGDSEVLEFDLVAPEGAATGSLFTIRATVDPEESINECDEDDNTQTVDLALSCEPKP